MCQLANGNDVELRDVLTKNRPQILDLGPDMMATDLSVSADGRWLYVFMHWDKTNDFPANYTTVYRAQTWDLATLTQVRQWDYPVTEPMEKPMALAGKWIVQDDPEAGTTIATDLLTGDAHAWPFRRGWRYLSPDRERAVWFRYFGFPVAEQGIEIWATDTWLQIDAFRPDLETDWYLPYRKVAFGPDPTLIAIAYEGHLALWRLAVESTP